MGLTDEQIGKLPAKWQTEWARCQSLLDQDVPLTDEDDEDWRGWALWECRQAWGKMALALMEELVKQIERAEKAEAAYQSILTHLLEEREQVYEAEEDDIQAGAQCLENPGVR